MVSKCVVTAGGHKLLLVCPLPMPFRLVATILGLRRILTAISRSDGYGSTHLVLHFPEWSLERLSTALCIAFVLAPGKAGLTMHAIGRAGGDTANHSVQFCLVSTAARRSRGAISKSPDATALERCRWSCSWPITTEMTILNRIPCACNLGHHR